MSNKTIGVRLAGLRKERGLSQRELADRMGYKSDATIAKWEAGANVPNGGKLAQLAQILNTTTDYILFGGNNHTVNTIKGDVNGDISGNVATLAGDIHGNVSFGSSIQKEDLHEVASTLNLTDRELQEKTLQQVSELKASQDRLQLLMESLLANQSNILANMKNVDDAFRELVDRDGK